MIYSVWNQGKRAYDYYETAEVNHKANSPKPKHIPSPQFGATLTQAAWPLPRGAKYVGTGDRARGRVSSLGDDSSAPSLMVPMLAILAFAGFYLWADSKR